MTTFTDQQILAAIPSVSKRQYGHDGGGVTPEDIALLLAPEPGTYNVANEPARRQIARSCAAMARGGLLRPGNYHGTRFYRLVVAA